MNRNMPCGGGLSLNYRSTALVALLVLMAWGLLFYPQLFTTKTFVLGDAPVYRPFAELSREQWSEHHTRTFWNPYVMMGVPASSSLADARPQFLPDVLLDWYESIVGQKTIPLLWPLLAHLAGMLAVAALARRQWQSGPAGMVGAALVWGLMPGLLIPFGYGHGAQFVSASLIPVALLFGHMTVSSPSQGAYAGALALALVMGIQCLFGHPQFIVYSGMLVVIFAITQAWNLRQPKRLFLTGIAIILGAAIAAAMWWPALLYSQHSYRGLGAAGVGLGEVAKYSLAPRDLLSLVWPQAVGFGGETYWGGMAGTDYSPYLGVSVVLLAF